MDQLVLSLLSIGIALFSIVISIAAFVRIGRWRTQDKAEQVPAFRVTATPIYRVVWRNEGDKQTPDGLVLATVEVTVENTSKVDASLNHVGISTDNDKHIFGEAGRGNKFPLVLAARHQLSWSIDADEFFPFLWTEEYPDLPKQESFTVFVSQELAFGATDSREWHSATFQIDSPEATP